MLLTLYRYGVSIERIFMKKLFLVGFCLAYGAFAADTVTVPVKEYAPSSFAVLSRLYSQDGTQRFDGCSDGKLRIFTIPDTIALRNIAIGASRISRMQFTPDRLAIMVMETDSTMYKVDPAGGAVFACDIAKSAQPMVVAFSPDGGMCVSFASPDSSWVLWNLSTGTHRGICAGLKGRPSQAGMVFSPDGALILAMSAMDTLAQLRSVATDSLLYTYRFSDTMIIVPTAAFTPDGKRFAVPMHSIYPPVQNKIAIVQRETGETTFLPALSTDVIVTFAIACQELAFSSDAALVLVGDGYEFGVWDVKTQAPVFSQECWDSYARYACWFSPDDKSLFVNRTNSGLLTDSLLEFGFAARNKTVLSALQPRPAVEVSGFDANGSELCIGRYHYNDEGRNPDWTYWDSIVYWNGETNREILKRKYVPTDGVIKYTPSWRFSPERKAAYGKNLRIFHVFHRVYVFGNRDIRRIGRGNDPLFP